MEESLYGKHREGRIKDKTWGKPHFKRRRNVLLITHSNLEKFRMTETRCSLAL